MYMYVCTFMYVCIMCICTCIICRLHTVWPCKLSVPAQQYSLLVVYSICMYVCVCVCVCVRVSLSCVCLHVYLDQDGAIKVGPFSSNYTDALKKPCNVVMPLTLLCIEYTEFLEKLHNNIMILQYMNNIYV